MRVLFYILAMGSAAFGILGLLRTFEALLTGGGLQATQAIIGVIGIFLAFVWIKRARAAGTN